MASLRLSPAAVGLLRSWCYALGEVRGGTKIRVIVVMLIATMLAGCVTTGTTHVAKPSKSSRNAAQQLHWLQPAQSNY
jgi:hypothetical protein